MLSLREVSGAANSGDRIIGGIFTSEIWGGGGGGLIFGRAFLFYFILFSFFFVMGGGDLLSEFYGN